MIGNRMDAKDIRKVVLFVSLLVMVYGLVDSMDRKTGVSLPEAIAELKQYQLTQTQP